MEPPVARSLPRFRFWPVFGWKKKQPVSRWEEEPGRDVHGGLKNVAGGLKNVAGGLKTSLDV